VARLVLLVLLLVGCSAPGPADSPEAADAGRSVDTGRAAEGSPPPGAGTAPSPRDAAGGDAAGPGPDRGAAGPGPADPDAERLPAYVASIRPIGSDLANRMRRSSHRPGCPLRLAELRHLRMSFVGFDGRAHVGEMVIHRDHARAVTEVFERLYAVRWPIQRMRLVDHYEGDDNRSMAANNTSGYNCRRVAGGRSWSMHAYGMAIDLNPVQNPYVTATSIAPPAGRPFAAIDRAAESDVPAGVIREGDVVVRAFARIGWGWGGDWVGSKDFQHFSASGR
jgi:hypothetical protein